MKNARTLSAGLAVLLLAAAGWAAYEKWGGDESVSSRPGPLGLSQDLLVGPMAVFELWPEPRPLPQDMIFESATGPVRFADFQGRVLLVNLWATWCAPCIEELPTLDRLQAELGGPDFRVLPVSLDREPVAQAQAALEKFGASRLRTIADREMAVMGSLGITGLPTTLLVDRQGREIGRYVGPADWSGPEATALVRAAIDGGV